MICKHLCFLKKNWLLLDICVTIEKNIIITSIITSNYFVLYGISTRSCFRKQSAVDHVILKFWLCC